MLWRPALQKALADNSARSLKGTNNGLKSLNRPFRGAIQARYQDIEIQVKQEAVEALNR